MKHKITYEEDTIYDHLFRPSCSCGWHKGSFCSKDLAVMYAHSHLQDETKHLTVKKEWKNYIENQEKDEM